MWRNSKNLLLDDDYAPYYTLHPTTPFHFLLLIDNNSPLSYTLLHCKHIYLIFLHSTLYFNCGGDAFPGSHLIIIVKVKYILICLLYSRVHSCLTIVVSFRVLIQENTQIIILHLTTFWVYATHFSHENKNFHTIFCRPLSILYLHTLLDAWICVVCILNVQRRGFQFSTAMGALLNLLMNAFKHIRKI